MGPMPKSANAGPDFYVHQSTEAKTVATDLANSIKLIHEKLAQTIVRFSTVFLRHHSYDTEFKVKTALLTWVKSDGSFVEMTAERWAFTRGKSLEIDGRSATGIPTKRAISGQTISRITVDNSHDITIETIGGDALYLTWISDTNSMSCKMLVKEVGNLINKNEISSYGAWIITGFRENDDSLQLSNDNRSGNSYRQETVKASIACPAQATVPRSHSLKVNTKEVPLFMPSKAEVPSLMQAIDSHEEELKIALQNAPKYFQSFFNDLLPLTSKGFSDDVISASCFDEDLYCALVKEMHRYTLAEISANQDQIAKQNAGLGSLVGSFLGLFTGNIFAPFLGHTVGKNMTDRSRRIEEFLPDPKLLFNQDPNSYLSWSRGQVSSPRLRRLIIDRRIDSHGGVYFRLVPAIVTSDSVYPIQLFKLEPSSYFYRPLAAGIGDDAGRKQPNYDPIKIQRKYFHIRTEGEVSTTDISLNVYGRDIEEYNVKLYRFTGQSLDYFYADFKIQPGSVF
jgi:hypothetical protein